MKLFIVFSDMAEKVTSDDLPRLVFQPILDCGLVTQHEVFLCSPSILARDPHYYEERMAAAFNAFKPDLVLYSSPPYPRHVTASHRFWEAAREARVPVMTIFWDTRVALGDYELDLFFHSNISLVADSLASYYRLTVLNRLMRRNPTEFNTVFCSGMLFRPEDFPIQNIEKQYDVLLLGSIEAQRVNLVSRLADELKRRGIGFTTLGGITNSPDEKHLSHEDYIRAINSARILITSQTREERLQIKNKVFEFMSCGAFVLIDRNFEYESVLPVGCVAYYNGFDDLVKKIAYYHAHPEHAQVMAQRGHEWFTRTFNPRNFWADVLTAVHQRRDVMPIPCHVAPENYAKRQVETEIFSLALQATCNSRRLKPLLAFYSRLRPFRSLPRRALSRARRTFLKTQKT